MKEIIFNETQRFRNTAWLYLVVLLFVFMVSLTIYGLYSQLYLKIPFGSNPMSDGGLILMSVFTIALPALLLWLFFVSRLETIVANDGGYYRYIPFINKFRKIDTYSVDFCEVRKYHPIYEFGGWGIRYSLKQKTMCYNVRGNLGVFLQLKNGKKLLLGSQNPHEFKSAIDKIRGVK